ncbi:hypothetical protein VNI00_004223 [Paramarasmius palmivorus]|uniref:Uncharacterized protein n=1 Tax=Paramarasmius palmivorus TaxID=297713 RepID=A0AAW0DMY8_9AGAR
MSHTKAEIIMAIVKITATSGVEALSDSLKSNFRQALHDLLHSGPQFCNNFLSKVANASGLPTERISSLKIDIHVSTHIAMPLPPSSFLPLLTNVQFVLPSDRTEKQEVTYRTTFGTMIVTFNESLRDTFSTSSGITAWLKEQFNGVVIDITDEDEPQGSCPNKVATSATGKKRNRSRSPDRLGPEKKRVKNSSETPGAILGRTADLLLRAIEMANVAVESVYELQDLLVESTEDD